MNIINNIDNILIEARIHSELNSKIKINKNYISFIDIDDTVFKTTAKVLVKDSNNELIKELDSYEYNNYKLKPGEWFDFSQFKSSDLFFRSAKPINNVVSQINRLLNIIKLKQGEDKLIFLTARSDFDDKQLFLDTFRNIGIPVDDKDIIYIERAGNLNKSTPIAKSEIINRYLSTGKYNVVRMLDDSIVNLEYFLKLHSAYPKISFIAIKVNQNESLELYKKILGDKNN